MQEYAAKFAEFLERIATKIRAISVDRVSRGIWLAGMGILAATLGLSALIFLIWALFEILEIPLTTAGAFGVLAAIAIISGTIVWSRKSK